MTAPTGSPIGILISNLGTPQAPTPKAVRRYLAEFLSDRRVINLSPLLWWPILHGIILRLRPRRSARLYQKVWMEDGSPLLVYSQRQQRALEQELRRRGHQVTVALGMRYGHPSIQEAARELSETQRWIVLPLYPQFSNATTASTFDALHKTLQEYPESLKVQRISSYAEDPHYIQACAEHIREYRKTHGSQGRLLLSFHGLPKESEQQGDPYAGQCRATAYLIAEALGLPWDQWGFSFQSRFGPKEWLTPYTEPTLKTWAEQGVRDVTLFCPGFSADCLETLEEIALQARQTFLDAGGQSFHYIPALNDDPRHIHALAQLIESHLD